MRPAKYAPGTRMPRKAASPSEPAKNPGQQASSDNDLLNPPGRPCRCGGEGCREAAAWVEGPIVHPNASKPGDGRTEAVSA